jgi:hypothetical protein
MNIGHHRTDITSRVLVLDRVDIVLRRLIEIFHVTLIDRVDLSSRRQGDL